MEILKYIDNPLLLDDNSIFDLTLIADKYPYFQTAQLLRIKNLFNISPEAVKPILNYTAAYVTDRKILYYLLHPIQENTAIEAEEVIEDVTPAIKSPEKNIKDSIEENISDTLNSQIKYLEQNKEDDIEFSTSLNIKKEYGEGVEFDDYVVRINETETKSFELIEDNEIEDTKEIECTEEVLPTKTESKPKTDEDILTLINRNIAVDELLDDDPKDLNQTQIRSNSIIDSFIQLNPRIKQDKPTSSKVEDFSKDSVKENDHLITDTLANIYKKQGNYTKAIFAYEKLSLKYPEKSAYFADQINEIKNLIEKTK